ncbi:MAG TPA: PEP-CTERM sorting domain-containing protein [Candidatus Krumholzibacteria bacterium]
MNARHALVAVIIAAVAASPAGATVLSASNQAVGTKSSKADYLRVTEVQKGLNSTMEEINDAAVANGPLSASAPATGQAGYILQKEGEGGKSYDSSDPFVTDPMDDGLQNGRLSAPAVGRGQTPGTFTDTRKIVQNGRHGGGGGGGNRRGGDPHAAPEPSTWMLLGLGLAMFGGYATLRRRTALQD